MSDRDTLLNLLQELRLPPNFRIVLGVNSSTDKLCIKVLSRQVKDRKLFGCVLWKCVKPWIELRRIEGRSYVSLLQQINESPEFLEFEFAIEGSDKPVEKISKPTPTLPEPPKSEPV